MSEDIFWTYLSAIFDYNRFGFRPVATKILMQCLDYHTFIQFKRTCRTFRDYILLSGFEPVKLRQKLRSDWRREAIPFCATLGVSGNANNAKVFDNDRRVLCSVGPRMFQFEICTGRCEQVFHGHLKDISSFDMQDGILASGDQDGKMFIWNMKDATIICEKQLFGRIESLRIKHGHLVTAHFGKAADVGCISVRTFDSSTPSDIPVVFSMFGQLFPLSDMDFNPLFLSALEWSGTYRGVHEGNVNIYSFRKGDLVANLTRMTETKFTKARFLDDVSTSQLTYLATVGHDATIRLWQISNQPEPVRVKCIRKLSFHKTHSISALEVSYKFAVTRDITGEVIAWDIAQALNKDSECDGRNEEDLVLRRYGSNMFSNDCAVAITKRHLVFAELDRHVHCYDVWTQRRHHYPTS